MDRNYLTYVSTAALVALTLLPNLAWACPACALREDGGVAAKVILAVMIILPFLLAGLVYFVLRKVSIEEQNYIPVPERTGGEQRA